MRYMEKNYRKGCGLDKVLNIYNRNLYDGTDMTRVSEQITLNLGKLFRELRRDRVYSLLFKMRGYQLGTSIWENICPKLFYIRDMGLENIIIKKVVKDIFDRYAKYGIDKNSEIWVRYYINSNIDKVSDRMGENIKEGYIEDNRQQRLNRILLPFTQSTGGAYIHNFEFKPFGDVERKNKKYAHIGVFDIETYRDKDSRLIPYAMGSKVGDNKGRLFYISDFKNSDEMLKNAMIHMLDKAENNTVFYAHNMGGSRPVYVG